MASSSMEEEEAPAMAAAPEGKKKSGKRLAVLVGCNYAGTSHELRGCINDVVNMRAEIVGSRFGFAPEDVVVLTDADGAPVMPTGANIKKAIGEMIGRAEAGDVLFFHYSGHGTLVPAMPPHHHGGGGDGGAVHFRDEAIVPCDFNLITDVDFRAMVNRLPAGATFTIVSDSCHSGGLIDNEKEQIGPHELSTFAGAAATSAARFIPYESVVQHLAGASGIDASSHAAVHLTALFGADAVSASFSAARELGNPAKSRADDGILLSGCQTDETSADVAGDDGDGDDVGGGGGKPCGAFSSALQAVLAAHRGPVTNRQLVTAARRVLADEAFDQHPCLYCSDANADKPFLHQLAPAAASPAPEMEEETAGQSAI